MSDVRVRIAPSPTGNLHVGTARTALFNYLYAKHTGGKFILRIEDTDLERSELQYVDDIYAGLRLLGLDWDEGPDIGGPYAPYTQSERLDLYRKYADHLLESGAAYPCYCTPEELDAEKQVAVAAKRPYIYSRRCCDAPTAEKLAAEGRPKALRFRVPDSPATLTLQDAVRGDVSFETALIGDFVIMKSNGTPSYNFAVVIDDLTMKITHVIRGEDHVSNTPKQMMLYTALEAPAPQFAHVGMILAPDRSKLSKRHGATAVSEFIRGGYLPEAFGNFLSLLGWSPPDGQEIGTLPHFATQFTLERIVSSPAVFDQEKLNWLNGHTIRNLVLDDLLIRAQPFLSGYNLSEYTEDQLLVMLDAVREPLATLADLPEAVAYFFGETTPAQGDAEADTVLADGESRDILRRFADTVLPSLDFGTPEALMAGVKVFANDLKPIKMKTVMWAIRAATTHRVHGADLGKTLYLLGQSRVEKRLRDALA